LKIAYLISAHDNYIHLKRLINALDDEQCTFYVHIDKKSLKPIIQGENIIFIDKRINIHWGGFSLVRATINLLERAVRDNNDYYAFISGVDYPIQPNSYLYRKLEEGGEYIRVQKMGEDPYAPLSRYKFYYFTDHYNRRNKHSMKTKLFMAIQKKMRKLRMKKKIPFQLFTGSQWFVLSDQCVQYILSEIKSNRQYVRFFNSGFCSDESFFQTIIGNSPFRDTVKGNLTYTDWSVDPGPALITIDHIPVLKNLIENADKENPAPFFARKFCDNSADTISFLEKELRG
jgi:hypothetical protein